MDNTGDETTNNNAPNKTVIEVLKHLLDAKFTKESYSYTLEQATAKGDNYIGIVYRVTVHLKSKAVEEQKDANYSLILKVPPQSVARRNQFFARPCFIREALAYEEFLPLIAKFQKSQICVSTNSTDTFHEYPVCYAARMDEMNEAIFMQDLHMENFKLFNRFEQLNSEHVTWVMRIYAKLHANSFVLKAQQPEKLEKFQQIVDIFVQRKDDINLCAYFEELKRSTLATLDVEQDQHYIEVLEKYFTDNTFFELFMKLIDGKACEPYAVVCHGDCWINNIMFKYDEATGKVIDVRLIDWQVMRYASPITDLMYFIFSCTTRTFRQAHYREMLDIYYEAVVEHIERLGSDPESLIPRQVFDAEEKSKGAVGLLFAMILLPIITLRSEDTPSLEELSERIEAGATTDLSGAGMLVASNANAYTQRMRDVVMDCIDFGYIQ